MTWRYRIGPLTLAAIAASLVLGVDFAGAMLNVGAGKLARLGEKRVGLVRGDATRIPVADRTVDAVTVAFGIRNVERTQAVLDGTWAEADTWDGVKEGTVVISPYNKSLAADIVAEADKVYKGYADGTFDIFTGPIYDQDGNLKVKDGEVMSLGDLAVIDWFVKGVESAA